MLKYVLLLYLSLLVLMPPFVFVVGGYSSLAPGLLLSLCLIVFFSFTSTARIRFNYFNLGIVGYFILLILFVQTSYYALDGYGKPIQSIVFIPIFILAFLFFSNSLATASNADINFSLVWLSIIIIFLGWLEIVFHFHFLGYALREKPVFPFSEQSHYALAAGFFAGPAFINKHVYIKLFVVFNFILQGVFFPNLTMMLYSVVLFYLYFLVRKPIVTVFFCTLILIIFMLVSSNLIPGLNYFSSRLDLSSDSDNLTTLVFLQGWEQAWIALSQTYGLGVGFQMLGTEPAGYFSTIITSLTGGNSLNREDGGFLAAKLVGEFGIVGISLLCCYIIYILKCIRQINIHYVDSRYMVLFAFILLFSVEIFFRGYGYFSPGLIIFLSSIYAIQKIPLKFIKNVSNSD
ncbi:hypothetical protein ACK39B_00665 [Aeromonas veronii]